MRSSTPHYELPRDPGEQQKNAWFEVCRTLDRVCPDWHKRFEGSGAQKAIAAIEAMASQSETGRSDGWERTELPEPGIQYRLVHEGETICMFANGSLWKYNVPRKS